MSVASVAGPFTKKSTRSWISVGKEEIKDVRILHLGTV
jgi:hypothetical protein